MKSKESLQSLSRVPLSKMGFPGNSVVKNPPASTGDTGLVTGLGGSPGGGNGNPLQYFCLENPMDRGAWWATAQGVVKESDMTEQLSTNIRAHYLSKIVIVHRVVHMSACVCIFLYIRNIWTQRFESPFHSADPSSLILF